MTHLGIERSEAATWTMDWHLPRPQLSRAAKWSVAGRAVAAVVAFMVLFVVAQWGRPPRPAPYRHKVKFTAETLDGRAVPRSEWVGRALAAGAELNLSGEALGR